MANRLTQKLMQVVSAATCAGVLFLYAPATQAFETAASRQHKQRVASINEFLKVYQSSKDPLDFLERSRIRMSDATYAVLKHAILESGVKKLARVERRSDLELVFFENGKIARYVLLDGAPGRAMVNNKLVELSDASSAADAWSRVVGVLPKNSSVSLWSLLSPEAYGQAGAVAEAAEVAGAAALKKLFSSTTAEAEKTLVQKSIDVAKTSGGALAKGSMASAGMAMTYNQLSDVFGDKCKALRTAWTACMDAQTTLATRARTWASSRARKEIKFKRAQEKYAAAKAKGEDPDQPDDIGGIDSEDGYVDTTSKIVMAVGEVNKALYDDTGLASSFTRNDIQCNGAPIVKETETCKAQLISSARALKMEMPADVKVAPASAAPSGTQSGPAIR